MTHTVRNDAIWRIPALLLGIALLLAGCGPANSAEQAGSTSAAAATQVGPATVPPGYHRKCKLGQAVDKCPVVKDSPPPSTSAPAPKPAAPAVKPPTVAQQQALEAAQSYLEFSGMSRAGLIRQLTSKSGDGFEEADAVWAVDHVKVDWNAEAVEAAKSYLEMGGFSKRSLTQQLTSKSGEAFTKAQAAYAVKKVGL